MDIPCKNLATRSDGMLFAERMQNQPTSRGRMEIRLAVLRPYLAIIVGTMKLPATRANPRIEAGKINQVLKCER